MVLPSEELRHLTLDNGAKDTKPSRWWRLASDHYPSCTAALPFRYTVLDTVSMIRFLFPLQVLFLRNVARPTGAVWQARSPWQQAAHPAVWLGVWARLSSSRLQLCLSLSLPLAALLPTTQRSSPVIQNVFTDLQVSKPPVLVPDTYVRLREGKHGCMELVSPARLLYAGLSLDYSSVLAVISCAGIRWRTSHSFILLNQIFIFVLM